MSNPVIQVHKLSKTFRHGFWRKRVDALRDVSFEVERGSIFGFLGPNGAGKTTTIKILTGLIAATGGEASVLGKPVPSPEARSRLGFLPENPYVYPYLTPREFVRMCGQLSAVHGEKLRKRTEHVLERVGMTYAAERPVQRLSKGMLQRTCLAAALVHEPDLLILDEPMSGLDPVGRKEVRDIILEERAGGRTVFFSSHILSDVESMCDQVTILRKGEVVVEGKMDTLLQRDALYTDIVLGGEREALERMSQRLSEVKGVTVQKPEAVLRVTAMGDEAVAAVLAAALEAKGRV
ncbi:MAG: ABC transporter ATP-binding protein, partial [Deltaproteobacteria bacterium HGW-Deltaproteobacteria-20]